MTRATGASHLLPHTPRVLPKPVAREAVAQLQRLEQHGPAGFYRERGANVSALSKLSYAQVSGRFSAADNQRLQTKAYQAIRDMLAERIEGHIQQAQQLTSQLSSNPAKRGRWWRSLTSEQKRMNALRGLGIPEADARRAARHPRGADLGALLGESQAKLRDLRQYVHDCKLTSYAARAAKLFEQFKPTVRALYKELGLRRGSFAYKAIRAEQARVADIRETDETLAMCATIAASMISGGLLGAAATAGAAIGALDGGRNVLVRHGVTERAETAESLGLATPGSAARERKADRIAQRNVALKAVAGAATAKGGELVGELGGHAASHAAGRVLGQLGSPVGRQAAKALVEKSVKKLSELAVEASVHMLAHRAVH